jgi:hypothetical protein
MPKSRRRRLPNPQTDAPPPDFPDDLHKLAWWMAVQRQRKNGRSIRNLRLYYYQDGDKWFPTYLD